MESRQTIVRKPYMGWRALPSYFCSSQNRFLGCHYMTTIFKDDQNDLSRVYTRPTHYSACSYPYLNIQCAATGTERGNIVR
jgi:hypothetical protein